jgi:hypothetical protein
MALTIERKFGHKTYGPIGDIVLTIPNTEGWTITTEDGEYTLGITAVTHLANFALQTLQDSYAGARSIDKAKAAFDKKLGRVIEGAIGIRATGPRDPVRSRALRNAMQFAPGKDAKAKREAANVWLDNDPSWLADAAAEIERDARRAAAAAKVAVETPEAEAA